MYLASSITIMYLKPTFFSNIVGVNVLANKETDCFGYRL